MTWSSIRLDYSASWYICIVTDVGMAGSGAGALPGDFI
jgi:hypothetical protein